jgi:hypothetical protein
MGLGENPNSASRDPTAARNDTPAQRFAPGQAFRASRERVACAGCSPALMAPGAGVSLTRLQPVHLETVGQKAAGVGLVALRFGHAGLLRDSLSDFRPQFIFPLRPA